MASVQKPEESSQPQKAFTVKAILFGLLGIVLVAGLAYFNENRLTQNLMIGNHFPITVFFYIFCLALFWNLLCSKLMPFLALRTGELTVTLSMILAACWAPTSGLFRYFHRLLILPWHFLPQKPLWIKTNVLDYIPAKLLPLGESVHEIVSKTLSGELSKVDPNLKVLYDRVYDGFVKGIGQGDQIVWNFPIKEWLSPMIYWGPMFIIFAACTLGLALLVHRQWAHHEQLSYPLASIADGVIKTSPGRLCSDIFSERLFWWGAVPVLTIHAFNYLAMWFPNAVPNIALSWNCNNGVQDIFPILKQSGMYNVHTGTLFFTILGIAYFIPSEVGLSLGLSSFILAFIGAQFYMMTGKPIAGQDLDNFRAGAYIGYALILLYTGRSYYFPVILKAFGLGRKGCLEVEVGGGLVAEEDGRVVGEGARYGHALLLAAGHLLGPVAPPVGEAHLLQYPHAPLPGLVGVDSGEDHRQHHVVESRHDAVQVVALEDVADLAAAEEGQLVGVELGHVHLVHEDAPAGGRVEAADHVEEGRLA